MSDLGPGRVSNNEKREPDSFPHGLNNAFLFAGVNALSFPLILSSPMVLYAKTLDAKATVLGIMAGMMPLLVIFQIPAAQYVQRIGYKKFVYAGWGIRVMFIFGMALIPVLTFLDKATRLALMLSVLFAFNLSRGISSCAWLPWITSLVPISMRGQYLVREAAYVNVACFLTILLSAIFLGPTPAPWQFSALFAFSALMGVASLSFLKRIPEAESPAQSRESTTPVPWREIAGYPPFRKLLYTVAAFSLASGGLSTFTVAFLKTEIGMAAGKILFLSSTSFLGGLGSLWFLGARLDNLGSKPILTFSFVTYVAILVAWIGLAGGFLDATLPLLLMIQILTGLCAALVGMANTRLAMAIIPTMGRNHFFALYSVIGSLVLGLSPILWGLFIDALRPVNVVAWGIAWNRYTIFFVAVALNFLATIFVSMKLHEPEAASMEQLLREILIQTPQRVWIRLWPRE